MRPILITAVALAITPAVLAAQYRPVGPIAQPDHVRARAARQHGEFVALESILADAERHFPGRIVDVELEGATYEIEILRADGVLIELEYSAHNGRLLEIEIDD